MPNKIIKICFSIVALLGILAIGKLLSTSQFEQKSLQKFQETEIALYSDPDAGIVMAISKLPFELQYIPNDPPTLEQQAKENNFRLAIDAGFFQGSYTSAIPAGIFINNGRQLTELVTDKQLSAVVIYQKAENRLRIIAINEYQVETIIDPKTIIFQTGPQVIKDNQVARSEISASINGTGHYKRTLFGYLDSGELVYLVTNKAYTLEELAIKILALEPFQAKILNLVNLDGGPSSAFYSRDHQQLNLNVQQQLPLVIGIR